MTELYQHLIHDHQVPVHDLWPYPTRQHERLHQIASESAPNHDFALLQIANLRAELAHMTVPEPFRNSRENDKLTGLMMYHQILSSMEKFIQEHQAAEPNQQKAGHFA